MFELWDRIWFGVLIFWDRLGEVVGHGITLFERVPRQWQPIIVLLLLFAIAAVMFVIQLVVVATTSELVSPFRPMDAPRRRPQRPTTLKLTDWLEYYIGRL